MIPSPHLFALFAVVALVATPSVMNTWTSASVPATPNTTALQPGYFGPWSTHIKHVITLVMENHDYDNYFGSYCLQFGPYCDSLGHGVAPGTCIAKNPTNASQGCVAVFNLTARQFVVPDMPHDWVSGPKAADNGTNDNFYAAEANSMTAFGEYNGSTIPIYWDLAEEYAMSDNFYAADLSYSLSNHWGLMAGNAPNISVVSYLKNSSDQSTYRTESNATGSIVDTLNDAGLSWKYYDFSLPSYGTAIAHTGWNTAYDYWSPLAGKAESYDSEMVGHFAARTSFLTDLQTGNLPQVSWVVPAANQSDHPGYNLSQGESFVAQLVDSVELSPYWNDSVIFVLWDDYGGWYDHVPPPSYLGHQLSFRAPILAISPYAREDYISHDFLTFYSILHYEEWQFNIPCQTELDCNAALPFGMFTFNETPRAPLLIPTTWQQASYPMPLQQALSGPTLCSNCGWINWPEWNDTGGPIFESPLGD